MPLPGTSGIGLPGAPEYDVSGSKGPSSLPGILARIAAGMQASGKVIPAMAGGNPAAPNIPSPGSATVGSIGPGATGIPGLPGQAEAAPGPAAQTPLEGSPMAGAMRQGQLPQTSATFSSNNRWLKNLSVASSILQDVSNVVTGFKQKKWDNTRQQSAGFMSRVITLTQAINQEGLTPEQKQHLTEQRDQALSDEKFHKALEKAQKDPNSPEAIGFNQAQQQAQQKAQSELQQQAVMAAITQAKALAAQQQATAAATKQETDYRAAGGGTTPAEKLAAKTEIDKANIMAGKLTRGTPYQDATTGKWKVPIFDSQQNHVRDEELSGPPSNAAPTTSVTTGQAITTVRGNDGQEKVVQVPTVSTTVRTKGGLTPQAKATKQAAAKGVQHLVQGAPKDGNFGLPKEIKVIGSKGLTEFQRYNISQGVVALDRTINLLEDVQKNADVFENMWSSGKIAMAADPQTGYMAFSRLADLTPQEEKVAGDFVQLQEHINTMRGPLGATGFRGKEAFAALQGLHGHAMQRPGVIRNVLGDTITTAKKLREGKVKFLGEDQGPTNNGAGAPGAGGAKKMPKMNIKPDGTITFE